MATPKSDKHKEYARFAAHCLSMVTVAKDQELSCHSARDGGRVAEPGGRCFASVEAHGIIQPGVMHRAPQLAATLILARCQLLRWRAQELRGNNSAAG